MSRAIWLIMYDLAAADEARYLDWFHNVHIPEKLARPGYTWAAHYQLVTADGDPAVLATVSSSTPAGADHRGYVAIFGGEDTRVFLNPSPAQIKPTQPPLTREMMGYRVGSRSLIASEEWRATGTAVGEYGDEPGYAYLDITLSDTGGNDEDYGAWAVQSLLPRLRALPDFEVAVKLLSTTNGAKHITISSFRSLAAAQSAREARAGMAGDEWSERVASYQVPGAGSPLVGRRIWPLG